MDLTVVDDIWFACRSKACAPPPVGSGGSSGSKGGRSSGPPTKRASKKSTPKAVSKKLQERISNLKQRQDVIKKVTSKPMDASPSDVDRYRESNAKISKSIVNSKRSARYSRALQKSESNATGRNDQVVYGPKGASRTTKARTKQRQQQTLWTK